MPLFNSVHEALWWAVYDAPIVGGIVAPPTFARFISRDSREQIDEEKPAPRPPRSVDLDRRPKGLDAAGQAALIFSCLDRFDATEIAHMFADGLKGAERVAGRRVVLRHVIKDLAIIPSQRRLTATIVARFYGRKITKKEMMKRFGVGRRVLNHLEDLVDEELQKLAHEAETRVHEYLQDKQVVA